MARKGGPPGSRKRNKSRNDSVGQESTGLDEDSRRDDDSLVVDRSDMRSARFGSSSAMNTASLSADAGGGFEDDDSLGFGGSEGGIVGTCMDMCPEAERYERERDRDLSAFEMIPGTGSTAVGDTPRVDHDRAVKKYKRAAAAKHINPADVRPEPVLIRTLQYLLREVVDRQDHSYSEVFFFVSDRLRALRKDYDCQGIISYQRVQALECIIRFHILSGYELIDAPLEKFSAKQNVTAATGSLTSLFHLYRDGIASPNEAEFRAYSLMYAVDTADFSMELYKLSPHIQQTPPIRAVRRIYACLRSQNWVRLWREVEQLPYLLACILLPKLAALRGAMLLRILYAYPKGQVSVRDVSRLLLLSEDDATVLAISQGYMVDHTGITRERATPSYLLTMGYDPYKQNTIGATAGAKMDVDGMEVYLPPHPPARRLPMVDRSTGSKRRSEVCLTDYRGKPVIFDGKAYVPTQIPEYTHQNKKSLFSSSLAASSTAEGATMGAAALAARTQGISSSLASIKPPTSTTTSTATGAFPASSLTRGAITTTVAPSTVATGRSASAVVPAAIRHTAPAAAAPKTPGVSAGSTTGTATTGAGAGAPVRSALSLRDMLLADKQRKRLQAESLSQADAQAHSGASQHSTRQGDVRGQTADAAGYTRASAGLSSSSGGESGASASKASGMSMSMGADVGGRVITTRRTTTSTAPTTTTTTTSSATPTPASLSTPAARAHAPSQPFPSLSTTVTSTIVSAAAATSTTTASTSTSTSTRGKASSPSALLHASPTSPVTLASATARVPSASHLETLPLPERQQTILEHLFRLRALEREADAERRRAEQEAAARLREEQQRLLLERQAAEAAMAAEQREKEEERRRIERETMRRRQRAEALARVCVGVEAARRRYMQRCAAKALKRHVLWLCALDRQAQRLRTARWMRVWRAHAGARTAARKRHCDALWRLQHGEYDTPTTASEAGAGLTVSGLPSASAITSTDSLSSSALALTRSSLYRLRASRAPLLPAQVLHRARTTPALALARLLRGAPLARAAALVKEAMECQEEEEEDADVVVLKTVSVQPRVAHAHPHLRYHVQLWRIGEDEHDSSILNTTATNALTTTTTTGTGTSPYMSGSSPSAPALLLSPTPQEKPSGKTFFGSPFPNRVLFGSPPVPRPNASSCLSPSGSSSSIPTFSSTSTSAPPQASTLAPLPLPPSAAAPLAQHTLLIMQLRALLSLSRSSSRPLRSLATAATDTNTAVVNTTLGDTFSLSPHSAIHTSHTTTTLWGFPSSPAPVLVPAATSSTSALHASLLDVSLADNSFANTSTHTHGLPVTNTHAHARSGSAASGMSGTPSMTRTGMRADNLDTVDSFILSGAHADTSTVPRAGVDAHADARRQTTMSVDIYAGPVDHYAVHPYTLVEVDPDSSSSSSSSLSLGPPMHSTTRPLPTPATVLIHTSHSNCLPPVSSALATTLIITPRSRVTPALLSFLATHLPAAHASARGHTRAHTTTDISYTSADAAESGEEELEGEDVNATLLREVASHFAADLQDTLPLRLYSAAQLACLVLYSLSPAAALWMVDYHDQYHAAQSDSSSSLSSLPRVAPSALLHELGRLISHTLCGAHLTFALPAHTPVSTPTGPTTTTATAAAAPAAHDPLSVFAPVEMARQGLRWAMAQLTPEVVCDAAEAKREMESWMGEDSMNVSMNTGAGGDMSISADLDSSIGYITTAESLFPSTSTSSSALLSSSALSAPPRSLLPTPHTLATYPSTRMSTFPRTAATSASSLGQLYAQPASGHDGVSTGELAQGVDVGLAHMDDGDRDREAEEEGAEGAYSHGEHVDASHHRASSPHHREEVARLLPSLEELITDYLGLRGTGATYSPTSPSHLHRDDDGAAGVVDEASTVSGLDTMGASHISPPLPASLHAPYHPHSSAPYGSASALPPRLAAALASLQWEAYDDVIAAVERLAGVRGTGEGHEEEVYGYGYGEEEFIGDDVSAGMRHEHEGNIWPSGFPASSSQRSRLCSQHPRPAHPSCRFSSSSSASASSSFSSLDDSFANLPDYEEFAAELERDAIQAHTHAYAPSTAHSAALSALIDAAGSKGLRAGEMSVRPSYGATARAPIGMDEGEAMAGPDMEGDSVDVHAKDWVWTDDYDTYLINHRSHAKTPYSESSLYGNASFSALDSSLSPTAEEQAEEDALERDVDSIMTVVEHGNALDRLHLRACRSTRSILLGMGPLQEGTDSPLVSKRVHGASAPGKKRSRLDDVEDVEIGLQPKLGRYGHHTQVKNSALLLQVEEEWRATQQLLEQVTKCL